MVDSTRTVAALAAATLLLAAGAGQAAGATPTPAAACPSSVIPMPPGMGLTLATTIKPVNTANSTVLNPSEPQIQCGTKPLTTHNDVVYTSGTAQLKLDIVAPATPGPKPLVVYLPGGGFITADRTQTLGKRTYIAEQGFVVASVQYRAAADGAVYTDALQDVKAALAFLRLHAPEYGIDPGRIALWGQSAGGYMAAMAGLDGNGVRGVIDAFGPSDLSAVGADYDDTAKAADVAPGNNYARWVYGPGTTKSTADYTPEVAAADPSTHVTPLSPPFLLLHGTADQLISPSQTLLLANALKAKGVPFTRYLVQGGNHGDFAFTDNDPAVALWTSVTVMSKIVDFLRQRLR
ncbi:prolyl oligopeptidase family serine peptidase [Kutzneria sp. NPDC052558]|uniref:prolyl oligopeptidase family serine peptidase n=1 Tax=Kutzneria sp. NPDC052558 TaxID=3364121 RepID=UPI0037CA632D